MNITWPPLPPVVARETTEKQSPVQEGMASFGEIFKNAVQEVTGLEQQAKDAKTQLITGEIEDVSQVIIASEKATLALQLTLQVRNKIMDAYHEIMRMQV